MAQEQIQEQKLTQQQKLSQGFTQQQLLQAHLTEMPIMQLLERINTEMNDNPALEPSDGEGNESSELARRTPIGYRRCLRVDRTRRRGFACVL